MLKINKMKSILMIMSIICICVFTFGCSNNSDSGGSYKAINVIVKDNVGNPLFYANVNIIVDERIATKLTDPTGSATFLYSEGSNIAYKITVIKDGYKQKDLTGTILAATPSPVVINVVLTP